MESGPAAQGVTLVTMTTNSASRRQNGIFLCPYIPWEGLTGCSEAYPSGLEWYTLFLVPRRLAGARSPEWLPPGTLVSLPLFPALSGLSGKFAILTAERALDDKNRLWLWKKIHLSTSALLDSFCASFVGKTQWMGKWKQETRKNTKEQRTDKREKMKKWKGNKNSPSLHVQATWGEEKEKDACGVAEELCKLFIAWGLF